MRLRRSDPAKPGLRRVRRGSGFVFLDAEGRAVDAATKERILSLVIPPAWEDVWICPWPNGHIQAVGTDARRGGDSTSTTRRGTRPATATSTSGSSPSPVASGGARRDRSAAPTVRTGSRAGRRGGPASARRGTVPDRGEEYESENGSYGVATLLKDHVTVSGDVDVFCFPAKSGVEREADARPRARQGGERAQAQPRTE